MSPSFFSKDAEDGFNSLVQDIRGYKARHTEPRQTLKELPVQNIRYHTLSAVKITVVAVFTALGLSLGYLLWTFILRWF